MGYPEYPNEHNNEIFRPPNNGAIVHNEDTMNTDSDDDEIAYDGYQPLGALVDEMSDMYQNETADAVFQADNIDDVPTTIDAATTIDCELERQVWSTPRPDSNIYLDETTSAQIISLMAQINLPRHSIPEWALSDDKWKEELLNRIRQRNAR